MSHLSDISFERDRDVNSLLDNIMYVMPTKTVLNSSVYLSTHDKHNNKGGCDPQLINSRKIGGNIEIPSYKGFSVVNGGQKSTQQNQFKRQKIIVDGVRMESNTSKRKVHIITTKISVKGHGDNVSDRPKYSSDIKKQKVIKVIEKEKSIIKSAARGHIGHTESHWQDYGHVRPSHVRHRPEDIVGPVATKSYNQEEVKAYMKKKKEDRKKIDEENFSLNREKENRIKQNLRIISEKRHIRPSTAGQCREDGDVKRRRDVQRSFTDREVVVDDDVVVSSEYSSNETDESRHSFEDKILAWQPLDMDTVHGYSDVDKRAMQQAAVNSKQTCDILDMIQALSCKMELSKRDILHSAGLQHVTTRDSTRKLRPSSACSSRSEINSTDESTDSVSSHTCSIYSLKDVARDVTPQPIVHRPRGTFYDEKPLFLKVSKTVQIGVPLQQDVISRLREENRRRYEQSLENSPTMCVPTTKQVAPVKPYCPDTQINCDTGILKGDPHRFMNVYQSASRHHPSTKHQAAKINQQATVAPPKETEDTEPSLPSQHMSSHQPNTVGGLHKSTDSLDTKLSASFTVDTELSEHSKTSEVHISLKDSHSSTVYEQRVPNCAKKRHNIAEARLSPTSLERQFQAEIQYYESLEISIQQLLQADKFQGVAVAQQETASLAQLFTARQSQDSLQRDNNDRLTTVLENITKNIVHGSRRKHQSYSNSSTSSKTSSVNSSNDYRSKVPAKSSTETDASEIEEEIVDHMSSSMTTPMIEILQKPPIVSSGKNITAGKNDIRKSHFDESEITENIENETGSFEEEVGMDKTDSESRSIKTVSTLRSVESSHTLTDNKDASPKEISTDKSLEEDSFSNKMYKTTSKVGKKPRPETSMTQSTISECLNHSCDSTDSIQKSCDKDSTPRSVPSESNQSEMSNSVSTNRGGDYSLNTFENSTAKSLRGAPGDNSSTVDHSDIEARISALTHEKNRKKDLVTRLSKEARKNKNVRKERALENQIQTLNAQISCLEKEIALSDVSLSSISSIPSPIVRKKSRNETSKENVLPNHSSRSSSSSASLSVHKDNDKLSSLSSKNKTISDDSSSSSTIVSDKNASLSMDEQRPRAKADEVDTPRSVKQLQFGDINEEYSASDRDSSEIRTSSDKSKLSREITDNGATKSKSEKFHFLNLNERTLDEQIANLPDDEKVAQDDNGMMSARTIHSEISDIPDECVDFSDGEMEEMDNCVLGATERSEESSFKDVYSENFSDSSSHKTDGKVASDNNDDDTQPQQLPEVHSPIIPPRRREKTSAPTSDVYPSLNDSAEHFDGAHLFENYTNLIDSIAEKELNSFVAELVQCFLDGVTPVKDSLSSIVDKESSTSYELLVPWSDDFVIPLVDVAVEILFAARKNRIGSTEWTLKECGNNLPIEFTRKNDEETMQKMMSQSCSTAARHVHRVFIYGMVLEIVSNIYALDDDEESSAWMQDLYNVKRTKMITLWRGGAPPDSVDLVKSIVKDELRKLKVLTGDRQGSMKRSRLHSWFLRQHQDRVDKILVDETIREEGVWSMYEKLEEEIVFHWSDVIVQQLIDDDIGVVIH